MKSTVLYPPVATFFGTGYFPVFPGTVASLVVAMLHGFIGTASSPLILAAALAAGFPAAGQFEKASGIRDDGRIVIDEVAGMELALILAGGGWSTVIIIFVLFRFFDIIKPFPAFQAQALNGAVGIFIDDLIAGLYAAGAYAALRYFILGRYGL